MAWYGDVQLKGEEASDIRTLAEGIEEQQDIFLKGVKEKDKRDKIRKLIWGVLRNPLIDKQLAESDKKKAPKWMRKFSDMFGYDLGKIDYGDPEAISKLETPWTAGKAEDYGKEFTEIQEEMDIPYWETFLGERKDEVDLALKILPLFGREGGYVPTKYYGGGSVQGNSSPTIAEYFNKQNKTLGGSNIESLASRLGRG